MTAAFSGANRDIEYVAPVIQRIGYERYMELNDRPVALLRRCHRACGLDLKVRQWVARLPVGRKRVPRDPNRSHRPGHSRDRGQ